MKKLSAYIAGRKGMTQASFAATIGVSPGFLSMLVNGKRMPTLALALRIKEATKGRVKPEDWAHNDIKKAGGNEK